MRTEKDFLGEMLLPADALYGVHSLRAKENFPDKSAFPLEWYQAMAIVKRACYMTAKEFYKKTKERFDTDLMNVKLIDESLLDILIESAAECEESLHSEHFIVPAISGGAGTSINMNMNEILTNLSLQKLGHKPGDYSFIDPIEHANIFQSTNDIVPTALRIAIMKLLNNLEESVNHSRVSIENIEKKYRDRLRMGYTQMQEAVPTTFGRLFSSYSDALSRDWWRISKCHERIKVVNLGGSAIGTSITLPRYFVTEVVRTLQQITGLPVTHGENLVDATNNLDPFVEVHGMLKAHAVNLEKMVNDLRLLSSDIFCVPEIEIPQKQAGSSIMPGKVNPVIPEFVISSVHRVYSNDSLITSLCAQGCLELNAYLPVIGSAFLESINLLIACNQTINSNLLKDLTINAETAESKVFKSPAITTALIPYIGYNKATEVAKYMKQNKKDIYKVNEDLKFIQESKLREILKPENLVRGGFSVKDLLEEC
jgi:aspartate ammonia-lyase